MADQEITSKAEYGQKHYEGVGAAEGRELPKSCHAYIDNRDGCWLAYVNKYPDLLDSFATNFSIQTDEEKIKFAKTHYSLFGVTEQRTFPNGCSNIWVEPPPTPEPETAITAASDIDAYCALPSHDKSKCEDVTVARGSISINVSRK